MSRAIAQAIDFPRTTAIDQAFVARAFYKDAYSIALQRPDASPVELFDAIFGHRPAWMKAVMLCRNWLAARAGLEVPAAEDLLRPKSQQHYEVGNQIGPWPIYALNPLELIAGRDNKHLDFRLSVLRETNAGQAMVIVSTVCVVNNAFGKRYLWLILPFHRWGLRWLMTSAAAKGRL